MISDYIVGEEFRQGWAGQFFCSSRHLWWLLSDQLVGCWFEGASLVFWYFGGDSWKAGLRWDYCQHAHLWPL